MNNIILFDGYCNLCSGLMRFINRRNAKERFIFIPLESDEGQQVAARAGLPQGDADTVVLVMKDRYYYRSTAVLNILRILGGAWGILYIFIIIPPFIRDFFYRLVARHRHIIFGMRGNCEV